MYHNLFIFSYQNKQFWRADSGLTRVHWVTEFVEQVQQPKRGFDSPHRQKN